MTINIYWAYINRLDETISKIPRIEIAQHLAEHDFNVTLLTGYRNEFYHPKSNYAINIKYFRSPQRNGLFKLSLNISILYWLLKNATEKDIIILPPESLWMCLPLQKIIKCKVHLDIRTLPVEINNLKMHIDYFLFWFLQIKLFSHFPNSFSFITELLKENIEQKFKIKFNDHVIWHSGVNIEHFKIVRKLAGASEEKRTIVFTYLGVCTKNRGIDLVLQAIHKLEDTYKKHLLFQIIGDGSFLPFLKEMTHDLQLDDKIIYKGYIPYEEVPHSLIGTDIFICPLPDRIEWNVSSPIKIFEYCACTKPIILTPIPAHKAIINSNNFIVWTKGDDVEDFIEAFKYAISNIKTLKQHSLDSIKIVQNRYEWRSQAKIFADYLNDKFQCQG